MPVYISIGLKAPSIEIVSEALRHETSLSPARRDSSYLGEYDLFRMPEEARVRYNFVGEQGEWMHPAHQEYAVILEVESTERPDFFWELAVKLGFENKIIEEES
ncbi:MAG TPA: hypothetical protein VIQ24_14415 [Pyrinomonadaceae bacterium]